MLGRLLPEKARELEQEKPPRPAPSTPANAAARPINSLRSILVLSGINTFRLTTKSSIYKQNPLKNFQDFSIIAF
jgi:hypothetical protein